MGPGSAYNYVSMNEAVRDSGLEEKVCKQYFYWNDYGFRRAFNWKCNLAADKLERKS